MAFSFDPLSRWDLAVKSCHLVATRFCFGALEMFSTGLFISYILLLIFQVILTSSVKQGLRFESFGRSKTE